MLDSTVMTTSFITKMGFGLLAVITNIYCVWLVFRRATVAHQELWDEFARFDHWQYKFDAVVLVSLLVALVLGEIFRMQ